MLKLVIMANWAIVALGRTAGICTKAVPNFEITTNQLIDTTAVLFPITFGLQHFWFQPEIVERISNA